MRRWPFFLPLVVFQACDSGGGGGPRDGSVAPDGAVQQTPQCQSQGGGAPVAQPTFVRNIDDRRDRLVQLARRRRSRQERQEGDRRAALQHVRLRRAGQAARARERDRRAASTRPASSPISTATARWRSSSAATDGTVAAYEWKGGALAVKSGWPASTCSGGQCPEARGMAAARSRRRRQDRGRRHDDEHGDDGRAGLRLRARRQALPARRHADAWPRYNTATGTATTPTSTARATTATAATARTSASATSTTTPQLEIIVTYDNHQINAFKPDGTSILASSWYTNPARTVSRAAHGLGAVHPLGRPDGRGRPLPPHTTAPGPSVEHDDVAPVDGVAAERRRHRRRREERGRRHPERRDERAVRDAGATRSWCSRARTATARARRGAWPAFETLPFSDKPAVRAVGRLLPARRHPRADDREHRRRRAARDRRADQRRLHLRDRPGRHAALALRLREGRSRRRSRPRSSSPT